MDKAKSKKLGRPEAEFEHLGEVKLEIGVELFRDEKEELINFISDMFNDTVIRSEVTIVRNEEKNAENS